MEDVIKIVGVVVFAVILGVGLALLSAYPTMLLVNYLITPTVLLTVFGISALTFWKAFWLNFLCGILFKSTTTNTGK